MSMPPAVQRSPQTATLRLRLLSYNMQVGMETRHAGHYFTGAWRHALPHANSHRNLDRIAELVRGYDFVALQEADAGSLRTRYRNQVEYLAERAGYAYHGLEITRDLTPVACHCLGFLSRLPPVRVAALRLPSRIPGRAAMQVQLGAEAGNLQLILTHLSLGRAQQTRQIGFLAAQVPLDRPVALLGDLNCEAPLLRRLEALRRCGLHLADAVPATFPSWRPRRGIDHILVGGGVRLCSLQALPAPLSDHLPLAAEIEMPLICR